MVWRGGYCTGIPRQTATASSKDEWHLSCFIESRYWDWKVPTYEMERSEYDLGGKGPRMKYERKTGVRIKV